MSQKLLCTIGIFVLLASINKVNSVERLSASELVSHCEFSSKQAASVDGQFCIRYIQGFIDGAVATDERVLLNVEAELDKTETYVERAARVRGVSSPDRAAQCAELCLGEPESLQKVVGHVVDDLKTSSLAADAMARTVVYGSLRKSYPCESSS
ncbi:MAG: hypothetical protein ACI90U_001638 [Pseudomonadales bacterium]|jgi:hypothetical protein